MAKNSKKMFSLWQRCLFTFLFLLAYRILCTIPTPGVNREYFQLMLNMNTSLGMLNAFSGNNLASLSIMALNITPYISATIIIQLLQSSIESLKQMARGTKEDKRKVEIITIGITAILALAQAFGMAIAFGRDGLLFQYSALWVSIVAIIWAGSAILLGIAGKKMDENKNMFIGKGITLLLITNILSSFPENLIEIYTVFIKGSSFEILWAMAGILLLFIIFTTIAFSHESENRISVIYTTNIVYEKQGTLAYKQIIPIKLLPASVMPVIFATTFLSIPVLIGTALGQGEAEWLKYLNTSEWFNLENMIYSIGSLLYVALIFAFSYLYINISLNPYEIAEDLQKAGAFIEALKTNTDTAVYLKKNIYKMATIGAIILSVISMIPFVLSGLFGLSKMSFMGTSLLIIVSGIIETYKDIRASKIAEDHIKRNGGLFSEKEKK